jgi:SAM-dependent methyltransferase
MPKIIFCKGINVSPPAPADYIRYLAAKKRVDDRSLNRQVWDRLAEALRSRQDPAPLRVLEVGCGIGTMVERMLDEGLLHRAAYTGIDIEPEFLRAAGERLRRTAHFQRSELSAAGDTAVLSSPGHQVRVTLQAADLLEFMERSAERSSWDLLVAHAVLDLIDLPTALPRLLGLLVPGGRFYFTLNFDGATIFEPVLDPELDALIEALYHQTMDQRRRGGHPAGSCVTGRRLFGSLAAAGARVAAAGGSDWVVFPGPDGYPGDEAYFLQVIVDTVGQALQGHPRLAAGRLREWLHRRHGQIEAGELIYLAHQVDFFGYI